MYKYLLLYVFLFTLVQCNSNELVGPFTEQEILQLAYSHDYQYPDGFYHDPVDSIPVYYENTLSITTGSEREHYSVELHTNSLQQARTWSNLSNEYSSVDRELIQERDTEKYFEFLRRDVENRASLFASRVHKSGYFQPTHNKFEDPDTIGTYTGALSASEVQELIEYLWVNGTVDILYSKVLVSELEEYPDHYEHYIQSITIVYGDYGIRDVIHVYDNIFILDKSQHILRVQQEEVSTFQGHMN